MTTQINKGKNFFEPIATLLFFVLILIVSILISLAFQESGQSKLISYLMGAAIGFLIVWFPIFVFLRIVLKITRGMPYKEGQFVEVTTGEYKGSQGFVVSNEDTRAAVKIKLHTPNELEPLIFNWADVKKVKQIST